MIFWTDHIPPYFDKGTSSIWRKATSKRDAGTGHFYKVEGIMNSSKWQSVLASENVKAREQKDLMY